MHDLIVLPDKLSKAGHNYLHVVAYGVIIGNRKQQIDLRPFQENTVHHFPSKEMLREVVVGRYRTTFAAALEAIANEPDKIALEAFEFYCTPYTDFGETDDMVCLCGALEHFQFSFAQPR